MYYCQRLSSQDKGGHTDIKGGADIGGGTDIGVQFQKELLKEELDRFLFE